MLADVSVSNSENPIPQTCSSSIHLSCMPVLCWQLERKPIAQANTSLSVANWKEAIRLPQALGLDPRAANIVSSLVAAGAGADQAV